MHEDSRSLLNELFPARIANPGGPHGEAAFSAGELLTSNGSTAAYAALKEQLGVDLSVAGRGYALVRLIRKDASLRHAAGESGILVHAHPVNPDAKLGVQEEFRQALTRLRPCLNANGLFRPDYFELSIVSEYLDFFYRYGTHFVSAVDVGDCFFQVFAYDAENFARVKRGFNSPNNSFTQEDSANFAYYTTSAVTGAYGYAVETGKIVAFSGDAQLAASLQAGDWNESLWAGGNSVFALFQDKPKVSLAALDQRFTATAAIQYELTTLTLFAETQRREAWNRVLAGALSQRFPDATRPRLQKYFEKKYFEADNAKLFDGGFPGLASALVTPSMNVFKPRLQLKDLKFAAAETAHSFTLATNLLIAGEGTQIDLPGTNPLLSVQAVSAETSDTVGTMAVKGEGQILYCDSFFGILRLRYINSACTVLDGIRLVSQPGEAGGRVRVAADLDLRRHLRPVLWSVCVSASSSLIPFCNQASTAPRLSASRLRCGLSGMALSGWLRRYPPIVQIPNC